jgi:flagellar biosynthesis/type III secretory pathway protein FliH
MSLARGRVHRATEAGRVECVVVPGARAPERGVRLDRRVVAAEERAREIISAVERRAAAILADAESRAGEARERARSDGRAEGLAQFSAYAMRLREREDRADEASLDRSVELSRLLAERLLGHALSASPAEVASLAQQALGEARGARRIRIHANPADAEILSRVMAEVDKEDRVHAVVPDPALLPGDLRLETDIGVIDARLGPSLTRLAARLREALRE